MNTNKQEFKIIDKYFNQKRDDKSVILGIGDDAAIVEVPPGENLVVCTDTLIEEVHFPKDAPIDSIGYKALAANLSDLAAMGATPRWFTLALTLPNPDEQWLEAFSRGLFTLAKQYNLSLIGGDLTRGTLSITIQALGTQKKGTNMRRSGAKPGDKIYLSGPVGLAALGLKCWQKAVTVSDGLYNKATQALNYPLPRLDISNELSNIAHASIDISDGLVSELQHVMSASQCGVEIDIEKLPIDEDMKNEIGEEASIPLALNGGDDYQLCFTSSQPLNFPCIGRIITEPQLKLFYQGQPFSIKATGFHHF